MIAERKLRADNGNVEITGRDLREKTSPIGQGSLFETGVGRAPSTYRVRSAGFRRPEDIPGSHTTNTADFCREVEALAPGSSVLGGSDMSAAEVEEVVDLIVG